MVCCAPRPATHVTAQTPSDSLQPRLTRLLPLILCIAACRDDLTAPPTAPRAAAGREIGPTSYIVVFRPSVRDVDGLVEQLTRTHGGEPTWRYRFALKGYAASLSPAAVEAIRRTPDVASVVPDGVATLEASGTQAVTSTLWHLDRIDQAGATLDNRYSWGHDGAGVEVYILDTGLRTSHQEFGGRAQSWYDYVANDPEAEDANGHGTHVAATVGGRTTGVAKAVTLYAAKVLGDGGSGAWSGIIAAIDAVTTRKLANPRIPMVGNLSVGGGFYQPVNTAIENSVAAGVVWTIAAGNASANACNTSPASALSALTVGAMALGDTRASYSNWGTCLDLFAPGSAVWSAAHTADADYATKSGTSMAAPHVAGVAALYLSAYPDASASEVNAAITSRAVPGLLRTSDLGLGSPNRLLQDLITATRVGSPPPGTYALTVGLGGNDGLGSVDAPGITCSNTGSGTDCSESVASGTTVTLTATPAPNTMVSWGGACSGMSLTCTVTMSQAQGVIANFLVPRVQVYRSGNPMGVVTSQGGEIGCGTGGSCAAEFPLNSTVTLAASLPDGAIFLGWGGACGGTALTCTISLGSYATVAAYANYATVTTYGLTVARSGLGTGTVTSSPAGIACGTDCSEAYASGTTVTLTATPDAGSGFGGWSGCSSASGTSCTVTMTAARSVTAAFQSAASGSTVHVGGLTATKVLAKSSWSATVTVTAHDDAHAVVAGATVAVALSGATTGTATCTTGSSGSCSLTRSGLKGTSLTVAVTGITQGGLTYTATANHPASSLTITK